MDMSGAHGNLEIVGRGRDGLCGGLRRGDGLRRDVLKSVPHQHNLQ